MRSPLCLHCQAQQLHEKWQGLVRPFLIKSLGRC
jgi:hypothetical protein